MTAIAEHLDRTLKELPPSAAASVERLVWDVLNIVESTPSPALDRSEAIWAHQQHWQQVDTMLGELDWSGFERPSQGEFENREEW